MLKWRKDGTAKCGPFRLEVCQCWPKNYWYARVEIGRPGHTINFAMEPWGGERVRTYGTKKTAQWGAKKWLRKQAAAMLKDLGEK